MARPGRPPNPEPTEEWKVYIPTRLQAEVALRLMNPLTGKPAHGAKSRLIILLLNEWIAGRVNIPDLYGFDVEDTQSQQSQVGD